MMSANARWALAALALTLSGSARLAASEPPVQSAPGVGIESETVPLPGTMMLETLPENGVLGEEMLRDSEFIGGGQDGCGCDPEAMYGYGQPLWRIQAEGVLYRRTGANDQPLLTFQNLLNGANTNVGLQDLGWGYEPGGKILLSRAIYDCSTYFEISYLGIPHHSTSAPFTSSPTRDIRAGYPKFILTETDGLLVSYQSDLHDAEFNVRTDLLQQPFVSVFGGVRYIHYNDVFNVTEYGALQNVDFIQTLSQSANNDIIALNLGADAMVRIGEYWMTGITLKVAWGPNIGSFETQQAAYPNVGPVDGSNGLALTTSGNRVKKATGIFEAGYSARLQLTRNAVLRGGFRCVYLAGVALAPEQQVVNLLAAPQLTSFGQESNFLGDVLYYGPFLSLEIGWGACQ